MSQKKYDFILLKTFRKVPENVVFGLFVQEFTCGAQSFCKKEFIMTWKGSIWKIILSTQFGKFLLFFEKPLTSPQENFRSAPDFGGFQNNFTL